MLIHAFFRLHPQHRPLRPLVANFAFRSRWMAPVISRIGGVRASMENALDLLTTGKLVGVFPEGLRGVGKLYRERYRLSHFGRGGFVRLAREAKVPIIPVAIVGAEEIHPLLGRMTRLAKPLGLPYIPITPTFPLLGPLGLLPMPTKWSMKIGTPIEVPSAADVGQRHPGDCGNGAAARGPDDRRPADTATLDHLWMRKRRCRVLRRVVLWKDLAAGGEIVEQPYAISRISVTHDPGRANHRELQDHGQARRGRHGRGVPGRTSR